MPSPRLLSSIALAFCAVLTACTSSPTLAPSQTAPVASIPPVPVSQPKVSKPIKIGLVLGGGAARGFAHIGVIKVLESQGIVPDIVVGTSAGSVVGALYAAGNNGFALQKIALQIDEAAISDWSVPFFAKVSGLLKGEAIQNYVNKTVRNLLIEQLKIPFGAVATDLHSGAPILFRRGNTGLVVRASSAVPGVFQSVNIGGRQYVDGGLVSPVPVRFAREMGADFVIAVNISASPEAQAAASSVDVLLQTFAIMGKSINNYELKDADIVIRPELGAMKGNDFGARNTAILAGEQAAMAQMALIKKRLREKRDE